LELIVELAEERKPPDKVARPLMMAVELAFKTPPRFKTEPRVVEPKFTRPLLKIARLPKLAVEEALKYPPIWRELETVEEPEEMKPP
jgi:hypothetical protein